MADRYVLTKKDLGEVSEEFIQRISREYPDIVERTASQALIEELEKELEEELQKELEEELQKEEEEKLKEYEIIGDITNIPSVENIKPVTKRFGFMGGVKKTTKELLELLLKMIVKRNQLTLELRILHEHKQRIMMNSSLNEEKKKQRMLIILKYWISVRKGKKPTDYAKTIKLLNDKIESLKKYLNEERSISEDTLKLVENSSVLNRENNGNEQATEAIQQPATNSTRKRVGGKNKKSNKNKKKSQLKNTQRKNKQNKKKISKKQRKTQRKTQVKNRKTKKNKK